jgi:hypothetical protein
MALRAAPPVVGKTTEEDGNLHVVVPAFVLRFLFQEPAKNGLPTPKGLNITAQGNALG